jgi:hypothetical protein
LAGGHFDRIAVADTHPNIDRNSDNDTDGNIDGNIDGNTDCNTYRCDLRSGDL